MYIDDLDCRKFFKLAECDQTRSHSLKLLKQRMVNRPRQCVFGNEWNSPDKVVVTAESMNAFKTGLEASWYEKCN